MYIFAGEVELENIPLRKDALRFLDSSLCVRKGTVGHIRLKVPVSRLRSEPWSIEIDQVYVIIAPQRHEDYDEIQDNAVEQEIKLSALGKCNFMFVYKIGILRLLSAKIDNLFLSKTELNPNGEPKMIQNHLQATIHHTHHGCPLGQVLLAP